MSEAFCAAEGCGVALFDIDGEMPFDGRRGSMKPDGRRTIMLPPRGPLCRPRA